MKSTGSLGFLGRVPGRRGLVVTLLVSAASDSDFVLSAVCPAEAGGGAQQDGHRQSVQCHLQSGHVSWHRDACCFFFAELLSSVIKEIYKSNHMR